MLNLPPDFTFSQSNIQDFLECPRRFYLRHVRRLLWPNREMSGETETTRRIEMGYTFHRLAQQKVLGISDDLLFKFIATQPLEFQEWWGNFLYWWDQALPNVLYGERYAETTLSCGLAGFRLIAKYDLLVIHPDNTVTIFDWKTIHPPVRVENFIHHVQTRVYPFVFSLAGTTLLNSQEITPQQITMIYWFTADPFKPQQLLYSSNQYQADENYLTHLITEISGRNGNDFPLTQNEKLCGHCVYRTYCDRQFVETSQENDLDLTDNPPLQPPDDWEQISEIVY